jgi:predicted acyl esterase
VEKYTADGARTADGAQSELLDERQRRNHPDVSQIEVPLFSVANWGGAGLHLRGNIEGFLQAGSAHKQLRVHVGDHCSPFYTMEGRLEQKRFLDCWLKGIDTGVTREPPIKLAVRRGGNAYQWRYEYEWPLARTQWTPYFLEARGKTLSTEAPSVEAAVEYDAGGGDDARVRFVTAPFQEQAEFTGPIKLKLWVGCEAGDADLMVSLRHIDEQGREISYPAAVPPDVGAAYGWLRVSHRKLDPERSTPYRPYLAHDEIQQTAPFEVVPVEVEVWPSCVVLERGQRLELEIAAQDDPRLAPFTHTDERDRIQKGRVRVHTGPGRDSHLLLPRIPPRA